MNTPIIQVQYIASQEGLEAAMMRIWDKFKTHEKTTPAEVKPPATRSQAKEFLNISLPTLDILLKTGQIPSFKIGRQVRINWSDLEAYVLKKGA